MTDRKRDRDFKFIKDTPCSPWMRYWVFVVEMLVTVVVTASIALYVFDDRPVPLTVYRMWISNDLNCISAKLNTPPNLFTSCSVLSKYLTILSMDLYIASHAIALLHQAKLKYIENYTITSTHKLTILCRQTLSKHPYLDLCQIFCLVAP